MVQNTQQGKECTKYFVNMELIKTEKKRILRPQDCKWLSPKNWIWKCFNINGWKQSRLEILLRHGNEIHLWDVITHQLPNFNIGLAKHLVKLGHGWVSITSTISCRCNYSLMS